MKKYRSFFITFIVGLAIVLTVFSSKKDVSFGMNQGTMALISDGCFTAGVVLAGIGLLTWIGNDGFFNIFAYGTKAFFSVFSFDSSKRKMKQSYYEYKIDQAGRNKGRYYDVLIVGCTYLIAAGIFNYLFYQV